MKEFRGLGRQKPLLALVMAIFLFSLAGLPPFAGFVGKLYLFSAVIAREMYGFALIAAVNSVISLYFYGKIVKAMYLETPEMLTSGEVAAESPASMVFLGLLALPNLLLIIYWEPVLRLARGAINFYVGS